MTPLRAAVIGVGYLGRFHAQKYRLLNDVNLVAVCDVSAKQGQAVAQELETRYVADYRELEGAVDLVTIASNTPSHFEIAKFFLNRRIHVQIEKPMTETVAEATELVRLARANNLRLQVGHVERFNPALRSAQEKLLKPLFIESHRLAPFKPRSVDVDVVLDLMIHDLDVILSLVGSPVRKVSAIGTPVLTKKVDIANARLEFESGTVANVTASRVSQTAQRKIRVFQPSQYLSVDFGNGEVQLVTKTGEWTASEQPLQSEKWNLEKGDALLEETRAFVEAVRTGRDCVVTGEDGLRALELAEWIRRELGAQ
jgi:predicted dehydrogenase